jgi:hypothetical protein
VSACRHAIPSAAISGSLRPGVYKIGNGPFTGPTGTFRQRTDPTKPQIDLYARLDLPLPKKIIEITAAGR